MPLGIVLVHGYTGSPDDLAPLKDRLAFMHGKESVVTVSLPGHANNEIPTFNKKAFMECITDPVHAFMEKGREIILIGHSTGGTLLLSCISELSWSPYLVVLAAVPKRINGESLKKWSTHRKNMKPVSFTDVAKMASLINATGSLQFLGSFNVQIIHGEKDDLVPPEEAGLWCKNTFKGSTEINFIERADHDLFRGNNGHLAIDAVAKATSPVLSSNKASLIINKLSEIEPEAKKFLELSPDSAYHIALSPGGQTLIGLQPILTSTASNNPTMANIEITTDCDFQCRYCARTLLHRPAQDMELAEFLKILDALPHSYRITLVGLGEPLLHPGVIGFVKAAHAQGRRVGIVTNGLHLDRAVSLALIEAGLSSIAFSIDTINDEVALELRHGSNLPKIFQNISSFVDISSSLPDISVAIFSAVSLRAAPDLERLVHFARDIGVHALMLTDLNFRHNMHETLWKNLNQELYNMLLPAISWPFSQGFPLLSVHALEEYGLSKRYLNFLLLSPSQLSKRSEIRTWCCSPWQTMPVNVDGNITICDCQPESILGNILTQPLETIWNGDAMTLYRHKMLTNEPPEACTICPRF